MGKHKVISFIRDGPKRDTKLLDLIHYDVCVPANVTSVGGAAYFVTFIDDASKKVWDFLIKSKDQFFETFQKFHMVVERETNRLLRCIRTNNGGEFFSNPLKNIVVKSM